MDSLLAGVDGLTVRTIRLAEFYGRVCGVVDCVDENFITDFDAMVRIRELIGIYEAEKALDDKA